MSQEKTRVDFNAPASLVERADVVADILDTSRTSLLVTALRDELEELVDDEQFRRQLEEAYYAGRIGFETVSSVLGTEEATRLRLLRESLAREPPEPRIDEDERPARAEFYAEPLPEWTPDEEADSNDEEEADGDDEAWTTA